MRVALLSLLLVLPACQDVAKALGGCGDASAAYDADAAGQGRLLAEPPDSAPYPMALVISESAANKLFALITDAHPPPISQDVSPLTVTLTPRLPVLRIEDAPGCFGCVVAGLDFDVSVGVDGLGSFTGGGSATLGVPLTLVGNGPRSTRLTAWLDQATVENIDLRVDGLSLSDVPALQGVVEDLAQAVLRAEGPRDLTTISSWSIGKDALLAARGPTIDPIAHTLVVGLQTNLVLPPATTIEAQSTLPVGTDLAMQVHPGLLLSLLQRLMSEGEIPSRYDASGTADAGGPTRATLQSLASAPDGSLRVVFRVYQLEGALCGTVDLAADITAVIDSGGVNLSVRSVDVVDGTGAGQLVTGADWLAGDLLKSMLANLKLSLNYHDISEGLNPASIGATSLVVDGRGVTVNLDLLQ